ncbi:choice-of-anchor M domain-containing protein [Patulibacter sp. SYSU D01012]|uniref:choice-of-anchor M domain-containing protein n=1 Tax=Patulibacter sp. SYSU D01012 TaxID=2817381 RepID=UPI001B30F6C1
MPSLPLRSVPTGRPAALAGAALATVALAVPAPADAARRTEVRAGHLDAVAARLSGGRLRLGVKDATAGGRARWRSTASVLVRVGGAARVTLPSGLGAVGPAGTTAWLLPQVQRRGVVWAGWNTEAIDAGRLRGDLTWRLTTVSGPGRFVLFQNGAFGRPDVLFTSAKRLPQRRALPAGVHAHGNWAFTRRGSYRLTFALSGTSRSGAALRATSTLRLRVG